MNKLKTLMLRYRSNTVLQLLIICLSAVSIFSVNRMSAFLTDVTEPYNVPMHLKYGREFSIDIDSVSFNEGDDAIEIIPGEYQPYDPYLINNSNYDAYMFIEVTLPDNTLELSDVNSSWTLVESNDDTYVYAYGSSTALEPVPAVEKDSSGDYVGPETVPLCDNVFMPENVNFVQGHYDIQATGYAVSAEQVTSSNPKDIWGMIKNESNL